jgi:hypothetical protein
MKKRESKVETWIRNLESGNIVNKTMIVLNYIKKHPYTDINEIRTVCDLPHQTVTACLSNIMDEGVVKMVGQRECNNNVYSTLLFIQNHPERMKLRSARAEEKMVKWMRQGLNKHSAYLPEEIKIHLQKQLFTEE